MNLTAIYYTVASNKVKNSITDNYTEFEKNSLYYWKNNDCIAIYRYCKEGSYLNCDQIKEYIKGDKNG